MKHGALIALLFGLAVGRVPSQDLIAIDDEPPGAPRIIALIDAVTPKTGTSKRLARNLAAVGPSAVPVLFAGLGPTSPLRDDVRCEIEQALKLIGPAAVHAHVRAILADEPNLELRMRSLRVVGVVGGRGAWSLVQQLLTDVHEHTVRSAAVSGSIRVAVVRAVGSDPGAPASIARSWSELDDSWRPSILRALSEAGSKRSTALLVRLVDRDEKNRAAALAALVKTPLLAIESLDPRSWRSLRTRLESKHADVRRLAAAIVARGHDVGAFHDLVDLMEDDDSMVRRGASQALRRMTGLGATTDVGRWRSWYAGEQEWRADRIDDDLQLLESADPCVVAATLRSLTQHRLLRDAFLADIHHVLDHEDAAVREIACRTLAALGSPGSAPDLVPLLEDPVERVRSAAHAALLGVTGLRHGPDRGLWRSALRPR